MAKTRLYVVTRPDAPEDECSIIIEAGGRESAKRTAKPYLHDDPDHYIVEPLPALTGKTRIVWTR
jgi:hypothetical protein